MFLIIKGAPENFRNFRENKLFINSVKIHICNVKISRLEHALPTLENDGVISSFGEVLIFVKFRACEVSRK